MTSLSRHAFRRCRGVSWRSTWLPRFDDARCVAMRGSARDLPSRGVHTTTNVSSISDVGSSTNAASDAWHDWVGSVTPRDVDRVLRRVNRRIETGIVAMPESSRCLETRWDHPRMTTIEDATTKKTKTKTTLVFLHGFSDQAEHWREFAELLTRSVPGGCELLLPQAPVRPFVVGGVHRHVRAWFEPRLNHRAQPVSSSESNHSASESESNQHTGGSKVWHCGGIEPAIAWMEDLLRDLEQKGAHPGSVIVAGFSQGAALALAAAAADKAWRRALGGVLCFRGYLPKRAELARGGDLFAADALGACENSDDLRTETELGTATNTPATAKNTPPAVLLCQGGKDDVAPTKWARVAADDLRTARSALRVDDTRVELTVCEDRGHELGADDVWRARWWLRSRLERVV
jgi:predicted esterase